MCHDTWNVNLGKLITIGDIKNQHTLCGGSSQEIFRVLGNVHRFAGIVDLEDTDPRQKFGVVHPDGFII